MDVKLVGALELFKYDVEMPDHINLALVIGGELFADGQRHTGFVLRDFVGQCWMFHLGYNNGYLRSKMREQYNYLHIPILEPETETAIMSFLCLLLEDTQGEVPYSIVWDSREYFDENGKIVDLSLSDGFTCATFVLETLKRYGLDLVNRSTWPISEGDAVWQEGVIHKVDLSLQQFQAQVQRVGQYPRFRPEQALGAAHYYKGKKLNHSEVLPAGNEVVAEMIRLRA